MSKQASYGTRRVFKGSPCKKQAPVVRKGYSVPETPSYGTRRIFGVRILFSTIHSPLQIEWVLLRFIKLLGRTYIYHPESFRGHNSADNLASRGIKIKIDDGKALGP